MHFAGISSYLADQRDGNHLDDDGLLSDPGESGYSSGRAGGAENVHALSEKSGESPFPVQYLGHYSDSGPAQ